METNPNDYDRRVSWTPQQKPPSQIRPILEQSSQQSRSQKSGRPLQGTAQKTRHSQKMPKAQALALANKLKKGLAISSIMGFGLFSGLVAVHQVGSTATKAASVSSQNTKSILKKQGGNNFATSTTPTATSTVTKKSTIAATATKKVAKKSTVTATATSKATIVAAPPVSGTSVS